MDFDAAEAAIGRLANTMRLYGEARVTYSSLVRVDREEAIDNLDRAFEAALEAFHALYDVSSDVVSYFEYADTAFLISLRNALHHRNHPLFQSLLSEIWLKGDPSRWLGATFLLARHRMISGNPAAMTHYIRLDDIYARLAPDSVSPHRDRFLSETKSVSRFQLIEDGLAFPAIQERAQGERYPARQVYLDVVPIFISGVARAFIALEAAGTQFRGFDANAYRAPLTSELRVNLQALDFGALAIGDLQLMLGPTERIF